MEIHGGGASNGDVLKYNAVSDVELKLASQLSGMDEIREQQGRVDEAIKHYKVVAKGAGGDVAKAAYEALLRLDLSNQPESYVSSACGVESSGQLIVQVRNDTPVPVSDVQVQYQYVDSAGTQRRQTQSFSGELSPGKVVNARTGLTADPSTRCEAVVIQARPASSPSRP